MITLKRGWTIIFSLKFLSNKLKLHEEFVFPFPRNYFRIFF